MYKFVIIRRFNCVNITLIFEVYFILFLKFACVSLHCPHPTNIFFSTRHPHLGFVPWSAVLHCSCSGPCTKSDSAQYTEELTSV